MKELDLGGGEDVCDGGIVAETLDLSCGVDEDDRPRLEGLTPYNLIFSNVSFEVGAD